MTVLSVLVLSASQLSISSVVNSASRRLPSPGIPARRHASPPLDDRAFAIGIGIGTTRIWLFLFEVTGLEVSSRTASGLSESSRARHESPASSSSQHVAEIPASP